MTKQRILQFIDFKRIGIKKFLEETGIKRGFLDTDKLNSSVTDIFLAKIIAVYPEINLDWLLTGKGDMLRKEGQQQIVQTGEHNINHGHNIQGEGNSVEAVGKQLMEIIREKDKQIESLHKIIDKLSK